MRCRRLLFLSLLLLMLPTVTLGQSDATDEFVLAEIRRQGIPGLALAVIKDGQIVKAAGYGMANIKDRRPATAETVFWLASVSKQFISAGVMILVQDGHLDLDDSVTKYLDAAPQAWRPITIRHLLSHTSGLVREPPAFDPYKTQSDAEVIASAYSLPLNFPPGENFEYSNLGYFALAEVIRKVSGQPWDAFITASIFTPAGMHTTLARHTQANVPNRAQGYEDNAQLREAREWTASRPSGAFLSTVLDMAKWDAALYADNILTSATRQQMWTPAILNNGTPAPYGFGWYVASRGARRIAYHGGGGPGNRAYFVRYLDDRLAIVLLSNLDDMDPESIVYGVARFYLTSEAK